MVLCYVYLFEHFISVKRSTISFLLLNKLIYFLDERRMKIVEMGGAQKLVEVLGAATDDPTRKEALNAIVAIARSG